MRANVTIGRRRISTADGDLSKVSISIKCESSGINICEVDMDLDEFAHCITGLSYCNGEVYRLVTQEHIGKIGKKKEVDSVMIDTDGQFRLKGKPKEFFLGHVPEGWSLWDDGTTSQQNVSGKHKITICRYVDVDSKDPN